MKDICRESRGWELGPCSQSYGFSSSHVWVWELDHKEGWALKNWCLQTVVLKKALENPLDNKEIKPVSPKEDQSWVFTGRTDAKTEAPILGPPDAKSQLTGKDSDAGNDWGQENGATEDEIVRRHHWLNGQELEQTPGGSEGQGSLVCCCSRVIKSLMQLINWITTTRRWRDGRGGDGCLVSTWDDVQGRFHLYLQKMLPLKTEKHQEFSVREVVNVFYRFTVIGAQPPGDVSILPTPVSSADATLPAFLGESWKGDLGEQRQGCPGRCPRDSLGRSALKQDRMDVLHTLAKAWFCCGVWSIVPTIPQRFIYLSQCKTPDCNYL